MPPPERHTEIPRPPQRHPDTHKGSYGTVLLAAGSPGMLGAAILSAQGALRGGAGLVRAWVPDAQRDSLTIAVPCATTLPRGLDARAALRDVDAVVVGPGLGVEAHDILPRLLDLLESTGVPAVLDADALNAIAPVEEPLPGTDDGLRHVLTPHPGEAARLLGSSTAEIQRERTASVLELASMSGGVVVLKGHQTLVTDGTRLFTNQTGNPGMATGGSGDVLAGLIGALLAQGMAPFDAAVLGVHTHGKAGDLVAERVGQVGLTAADLPLAVAEVLG